MNIIAQIKNFAPRTKIQKESRETILNQLRKYGQNLYYRETLHGHMTASAIILNPDLDKILMVYHNIYDNYAWTGGHSDGEEDLYKVAYKEACEETGIKNLYPVSKNILSMEVLPVAEHMKKGKVVKEHFHYNITFGFICSEKDRLRVKLDENSDVKWVEIAKLDQYCTEEAMLPIYKDNIEHIKKIMDEKSQNYQQLPQKLLPWYQKNARKLPWRQDQDPYHVWISEIMLQQTRVDTVIEYYNRFLKEFPTVLDLAKADLEKVLKLWEGLGYYSRARNLHKTAKIVVEEYEQKFPESYNELLKLPGIGSYTAGAIASISFNQPVAAVDGNVLRVVSRITEDYRSIDNESTKKEIGLNLEKNYPEKQSGDFTQSLMELGATICLPNGEPLCLLCPANELCLAYKNGSQGTLPVRKEKSVRKHQEKTLFVFKTKGKIALQKRTEKGVLQGMWELPNIEGHLDESEVSDYIDKQHHISEYTIRENKKEHHIFTHIKWEMICYYVDCKNIFGDYIWVDEETMEEEYAIPTTFKKFLK